MVLLTGLEPVRSRPRGILSPLCLPIPPQQHISFCKKIALAFARAFVLEAPPRFELGMKLLQSSALPLGYGATTLYCMLYNAYMCLERETRFELATFALARQRSTTEPLPHNLVETIGLEPMTLCL